MNIIKKLTKLLSKQDEDEIIPGSKWTLKTAKEDYKLKKEKEILKEQSLISCDNCTFCKEYDYKTFGKCEIKESFIYCEMDAIECNYYTNKWAQNK